MNVPHKKMSSGASTLDTSAWSNRLRAYGHAHMQVCVSSLGRFARAPFSTAITVIVIAIALSLPSVFYVLVDNARAVSEKFVVTNQFSLFMKPEITNDEAAVIANRLLQRPEIASVDFISKQAALDEFRQYSGFAGALDILDSNPLPAVVQLQPNDDIVSPEALQALVQELEGLPEIGFVQFDLEWIKRLQAFMEIARTGVFMLSVLLGLAVIFIVSNTIRLELKTRRDEVVVSKLLGATNGFVRRPFLYSGFWYGFLGGVLAWGVVLTTLFVLAEPVRHLSLLYDADYQLVSLGFDGTLLLLVASSVLGIIGAWVVLAHQLVQMNPK